MRIMKQPNMFSRKAENIAIFKKTMKMIESDNMLKEAINDSIINSFILEGPEEEGKTGPHETKVSVTKNGSFEEAYKLRKKFPQKKITVLNFASAKHAGGMVKFGSSAQEEALCRVSTLFPVLNNAKFKKHYEKGKKSGFLYSDELIYSPNIKILLSLDDKECLQRKDIWSVDVITSAFPNIREFSDKERENMIEELKPMYSRRIQTVFSAAAKTDTDILVLGAWGCGVFKNNPKIVAKAFLSVQERYKGIFEQIVYPVFCRDIESENYVWFNKILGRGDENVYLF